jgi:YfiR/HmsC-like
MTLHSDILVTPSRSKRYSLSSWCRCAAVLSVLLPCVAAAATQEITGRKARKVEAAYLYNFAKFVHWPEVAFSSEDSSLVIGVLGRDPFGEILDDTVEGRRIGTRAIEVRRFEWTNLDDRNELRKCHILFVSTSERHRLDEILQVVADAPMLVVGETEGHAAAGGTIGFVLENGRIVFEINESAAERSGLKLSAKLLKLARLVETDRTGLRTRAGERRSTGE